MAEKSLWDRIVDHVIDANSFQDVGIAIIRVVAAVGGAVWLLLRFT